MADLNRSGNKIVPARLAASPAQYIEDEHEEEDENDFEFRISGLSATPRTMGAGSPSACALISVATNPGATEFTVIPLDPSSRLQQRASASTVDRQNGIDFLRAQ
jgi:hypothetical protein